MLLLAAAGAVTDQATHKWIATSIPIPLSKYIAWYFYIVACTYYTEHDWKLRRRTRWYFSSAYSIQERVASAWMSCSFLWTPCWIYATEYIMNILYCM